jgi:hypothetical protein
MFEGSVKSMLSEFRSFPGETTKNSKPCYKAYVARLLKIKEAKYSFKKHFLNPVHSNFIQ